MFSKDSVLFGLAAGIFVPIVSYAILIILDDLLVASIEIPGVFFMGFGSLLPVLAIVCNLIPFHYFTRRRMDNAMRGVIIPTIVFVVMWGFTFGKFWE